MACVEFGALEYVGPRGFEVVHIDIGQLFLHRVVDFGLGVQVVAADDRHLSEILCGQFDLFVLEQASDKLGARVVHLFAGVGFGHRQQHARFDFDQHGGHEQIFGGQFEVVGFDLIHVNQILLGHLRHRDVEDVEILFTNQVEQ